MLTVITVAIDAKCNLRLEGVYFLTFLLDLAIISGLFGWI